VFRNLLLWMADLMSNPHISNCIASTNSLILRSDALHFNFCTAWKTLNENTCTWGFWVWHKLFKKRYINNEVCTENKGPGADILLNRLHSFPHSRLYPQDKDWSSGHGPKRSWKLLKWLECCKTFALSALQYFQKQASLAHLLRLAAAEGISFCFWDTKIILI